jgi:type IV secretory pathway TrbD component
MRVNKVYKSINRPLTIMGVERTLFFFSAMMGAATFNLLGSFLGGILTFLFLFLFSVWATRHDPQMLRILMNSRKYRTQYCPVKFHPVAIQVKREVA